MISQVNPQACADCLRRARLLAHLAPYIEKVATGAPGRRTPELLRLGNEDLAAAAAPKVAAQILGQTEAAPEDRLRSELAEAGCWACCRHDPLFPAGLGDAADAPWALFGRGDPVLLLRLVPDGAVTVVGARRASTYGRDVARELGRELAAADLVVISGLAFGIDACAHRGAIEAGLTVAVLGCGADIAYPAAHRSLWRRIGECGLILSELPPGSGAWRWTFPARNRIMAALSGMTVVVEAAERSGSLITADLATDLGRDLGAVPGPVGSRLSAGPNALLAGGACLVRDAQDVLDAMLGPGAKRLERSGPGLEPAQEAVLEALELGAETCDAIAASLGLSAAEAAAALAGLESHGYVNCSLVGVYSRTTLKPPSDNRLESP
ncbi:MAG TPA: DNA-processing protein DprA [Solirubrobacterales bacterium]|nr:DNA-processing protein DprA [Solirubrobacterales bacterium]